MKTQNKLLASILLTAGIISLPVISYAADSKELEDLRAQVEELKQAVKVLDRKGEIVAEEAAAKKKETPIVKASEKGFGILSADGQHEIKLRGLLQADVRSFQEGKNITQKAAPGASTAGYLDNSEGANDTALLRRVRPTIEGTVFGKYDFRFTPEFGDGKAQVIDSYLDAKLDPAFKIRAGKYKPFVGLERLQSGADIKFLERSYVSSILPNRDVGVSIYGDLFGDKLNYAVGIHNGVVDGGDNTTASDINKNKDYAARVFVSPFKDQVNPLSGLSFGVAGTYGDVTGKVQDTVNGSTTELTSGYRTEGQQLFFKYNDSSVLRSGLGETYSASNPSYGPGWLVKSDGVRYRVSPQATYYVGSLGVLGEYVYDHQQVSVGPNGLAKTNLNNDAWQIAATYLVTGEDASFKGVKPKKNFDLNNGGWGAWEVVGRYSELNIDDKAFTWGNLDGTGAGTINGQNHYIYADPKISAKSAHTWTAGVNWYLNPEVKFALNYARTSFKGGAGSIGGSNSVQSYNLINQNAVSDREDESVLLARFQIAY
jgi:phosphate-selective porin OprO/OprP